MTNYTIWFTGLPYSGKTTVATELITELKKRQITYVLLDDKRIRKILSPDLRDVKYEYYRHVIRLANVSYLIATSDVLNIVCTVSPKRVLRNYARQLIKNFVEVYVKCPKELCEERAKQNFNGYHGYYEEPLRPNLVIDTQKESTKDNIKKIVKYLENKKILNGDDV